MRRRVSVYFSETEAQRLRLPTFSHWPICRKSLKVDLAKAYGASELRQERTLESLKADKVNRYADFKAFVKQERASTLIQLFTTVVAGVGVGFGISTFFWSGV